MQLLSLRVTRRVRLEMALCPKVPDAVLRYILEITSHSAEIMSVFRPQHLQKA